MESAETRNPGFSKSTNEGTANRAYMQYLSATGQTKKTAKVKFKDWLQKQKANGTLDKVLAAGAGVAQTIMQNRAGTNETEITVPTSPEVLGKLGSPDGAGAEKPKVLGMPVPLAIGVGVVVVIAVVATVVYLVKKGKKSA